MIDSPGDLIALAGSHGLRLASGGLVIDRSGGDFLVAHGHDDEGQAWVLRVPRRPDVVARAEAEERALRLVRPRLSVVVPDWKVFSPDLIAYPRLEGEPAAQVDPGVGYVWCFDETDPPAPFLRSLARVLADVHRIDGQEARQAGVPSTEPARQRQVVAARLDRSRSVLRVPDPVWDRWQAWISDASYWPEHAVLVHGDLHPPHLLVDGTHEVTGILDWTEAHVGDPATDFALLYATLGAGALSHLLSGYAEAGGRVWPRMDEHVIEMWSAYPAVIADFVHVSGDASARELGQFLLDANAAALTG